MTFCCFQCVPSPSAYGCALAYGRCSVLLTGRMCCRLQREQRRRGSPHWRRRRLAGRQRPPRCDCSIPTVLARTFWTLRCSVPLSVGLDRNGLSSVCSSGLVRSARHAAAHHRARAWGTWTLRACFLNVVFAHLHTLAGVIYYMSPI